MEDTSKLWSLLQALRLTNEQRKILYDYIIAGIDSGDIPLENGEGENSIIQSNGNNKASNKFSIAFGEGCNSTGEYSYTNGSKCSASAKCSHAEGLNTVASGLGSHGEGAWCKALGQGSHAEGYTTTANTHYCHAEGSFTSAMGMSSHAEGSITNATGENSHSEGSGTTAKGDNSHAEGLDCEAKGDNSHAEGYGTITENNGEHAEGKYNKSHISSSTYGDAGNTQHSVGIGNGSNRKNAFEIMQNGDTYSIGLGGYDGTNPTTSKSIQQLIETELELTGTDGTLTTSQIDDVLNKNIIINNGGQIFRLVNKQSTLTYRTYICIDCAIDASLSVQAIYIQLDSSAVNYGHWSKETVNV